MEINTASSSTSGGVWCGRMVLRMPLTWHQQMSHAPATHGLQAQQLTVELWKPSSCQHAAALPCSALRPCGSSWACARVCKGYGNLNAVGHCTLGFIGLTAEVDRFRQCRPHERPHFHTLVQEWQLVCKRFRSSCCTLPNHSRPARVTGARKEQSIHHVCFKLRISITKPGSIGTQIHVIAMMRSYHPDNSRTHQNTELKPDWACLVITWVTRGESQVTHCPFGHPLHMGISRTDSISAMEALLCKPLLLLTGSHARALQR